jgi:dsRNA-specific ribonuclease
VRVTVASASIAADSADELLKCFGLREYVKAMEMGDDANKRESRKVVHLQGLSKGLGVPVDRFVLFDDAEANVNKVREVLGPSDAETGCSAVCVDPAEGLTAETLLRGLEHRLTELSLRARFAAERAHAMQRGNAGKEPLRKMKQSHAETLAQGQAALDDHVRVASKLEKLAVEPGWWLAAPLNPACSEPHAAVELDWDLMEHAERLFATCEWPTLADAECDRLVRANATVVDDKLAAGSIRLCALATYATERNRHYELLLHVSAEVEGDVMTISGDKRSRRAHVGATAANRFVRADGSFRTQETERAVGYRPRHVQLLPMRSSHCDALRVLKRLLWRLEHLVRLTEPDVVAHFGALAMAPVLPLERLSAALTHPGASAEAVRVGSSSLPPAPLDRYVHDERGCCQWEELEWLGDAMLRFFAVVWVLVDEDLKKQFEKPHAPPCSVRGLSPAKEAIESNQQLHRRAKELGLPVLSLCAPFVNSSTLPQLRKQSCSIKDQADPMEALLGTAALAAIAEAPKEPELPVAIAAAFGFFHSAVLSTQQKQSLSMQPLDTAAKLMAKLVTQFEGCWKDVKNDEGATTLSAALVAQSGPIPFESVLGMLHACSLCRSGTVFERAEFLGDAFLQIAVSLELALRFPGRKNGEVSEMRSALVNNLHLGRLLIRRFGVPLTHRFVETRGSGVSSKQLRAIRTFIAATSSSSETALDIVQAIHAASQAEEDGDKQVLASNGLVEEDGPEDEPSGEPQYHSKRGEDYRKPLGDQYEAIVGLVLCAYKGDCEATWRCFVDDFFPPPSPSSSAPELADMEATEQAVDEDHNRKLDAALRGLRKTRFVSAFRRLQPEVPPLAAARPMAAESPPVQPMEESPPVLPMEGAATTSDDLVLEPDGDPSQAHAQSAPRVGASPPAAVLGGEVCDEPMAQAAAPLASTVDVAAAFLPSTAAAQQYSNPIGMFNERLQKEQISRDAFLRVEFSKCAPFRADLFHIESKQLLGSAAGHSKKKDAEKAAFTDILNCWHQRGVPQLLEQARQGGIQPALQAGVGNAPPPASQPLAQQPQHARSKRALEADICDLHAFASGRASDRRARARTQSPAVEMDETALDALIDKVESSETFKHRIKRLATKAGLLLDELEDVAEKAQEISRPPEKEHSAGRLFHDWLLYEYRLTTEPSGLVQDPF